jgi:hypothetical protein
MRKDVGFLILMALLVALVAGCGTTPEPTVPPPTQTPWVVIVTSTAEPERATPVQPTEAPQTAVATPARATQEVPTPTKGATDAPSTPGATVEATEPPPSPTSTLEAAAPTATQTPAALELKYGTPILLDPPPNMSVSWGSTVLFKWTSVGELAADEYYAVEFYRPPKPGIQDYGDTFFVKETKYLWAEFDKDPFHPPEVQGPMVVDWWVRVVRKTGETESGKPFGIDLSLPSQKWTLILNPKPGGQ